MTASNDETLLTEEDVYEEHQRAVRPTAHWAYLFGVLVCGLMLMLALIAVLGGSA